MPTKSVDVYHGEIPFYIAFIFLFRGIAFLLHTIDTKLLSEDLVCDQELLMLNGAETMTQCNKNKKTFQVGQGNSQNELPKITEADIYSCTGIVHVLKYPIKQ